MTRVGWPLNQKGTDAASSWPLIGVPLSGMNGGPGVCPTARNDTGWKPLIDQLTESPTWIFVLAGKNALKSRCLRCGGRGGPADTGATSASATELEASEAIRRA